MEFRQIRYCSAVAKERSFTKAAARLSVSQSAISEQIKLLESEIGFPLFKRTGHGIELTERGRTFLYEAERVLGDLLSLSETAQRLRGAPSGGLVLGIGSGMAEIFMPRLFGPSQQRPPRARLEILTAPTKSIFSDLHEERIDIGIAIESDPDRVPAGLVFERLTETAMHLITHPTHPLARRQRPIDVARLIGEPIIMSELTVGYGQAVLALFANLGTRPEIFAVADNIETMKTIVRLGQAVAIVPSPCVESEVKLGALRAMPLNPPCKVVLGLIRRRQPFSRQKEAAIAALREALRAPEPSHRKDR